MSDNTAIKIDFPAEDVDSLFRQISRAERVLHKDAGQALRWAGWHLGKTLGTATRVSPQKRKIAIDKCVDKKGSPIWGGWGAEVIHKGNNAVWTPVWVRGSKGQIRPAKTREEASNSRIAFIHFKGLAKAAWLWPTKKYGPSSIGFATPGAKSKAQVHSATSSDLLGSNMYISLTNKLDYIQKAMQGGANSVQTAMSRAARMMSQNIDSKMRKMAGFAK